MEIVILLLCAAMVLSCVTVLTCLKYFKQIHFDERALSEYRREMQKDAAPQEETEEERKEPEINERLGKDIGKMLSYDPYEAFRKKAGK